MTTAEGRTRASGTSPLTTTIKMLIPEARMTYNGVAGNIIKRIVNVMK